jgi:hypothetical protein
MSNNAFIEPGGDEPGQLNEQLLRAAVKLNTLLLASVFGGISGLAMFVLTYMSLYRGLPKPGQFLNLLGVFLPGYSVSHAGAWVGLFWGALIGALLAAMFYRIYARSIASQVQDYLRSGGSKDDLMGVTLRFDGNYLGLALGTIIAGGLFITTSWLVIRGTAEESMHAILLAQYLPGYSVSMAGGLLGAIEMFCVVYMLCQLFSWIYNSVARFRGRKPR